MALVPLTDTNASTPEASVATAVAAESDASVVKLTASGASGTTEVTAVKSNRSWLGAMFASGDMSVDSLIVSMLFSVVAYWFLCGWEIVRNSVQVDPLVLGGGFAAMLAAFAGGKTVRDWKRGADGQG